MVVTFTFFEEIVVTKKADVKMTTLEISYGFDSQVSQDIQRQNKFFYRTNIPNIVPS